MSRKDKTKMKDTAGGPAGRKYKRIIAGIIAAAVVLIASAAGIAVYNMPENRLNRQLETANKLLEDGEYEEAMLAFEEAIAIDPKSEDAVTGLADTYLAYAQSVVNSHDTVDAADLERTIDILEAGYEKTGREELHQKIQETLRQMEVCSPYTLQEMQNVMNQCLSYTSGDYYIPDEPLREICRKYAAYLERCRTYFPDENWFPYSYLPDYYYVLGEYELCLEARKWLYEKHGYEHYKPEERQENFEDGYQVYDEYGRIIYSQYRYDEADAAFPYLEEKCLYGEDGKVTQVEEYGELNGGGTINIIREYEYDESGRLCKVIWDSVYIGDNTLDLAHVIIINTYAYTEDGFTEHSSWVTEYTDGKIEKSEYDQDYFIDETGAFTEGGEPYNVVVYQ